MSRRPIRILGLDPGLQHTGWGLIEHDGFRLRFIAEGVVSTTSAEDLPDRLLALHRGLAAVIDLHAPEEAAVENTYVARNPDSALKLGQARGVVVLAPALAGLAVAPERREARGAVARDDAHLAREALGLSRVEHRAVAVDDGAPHRGPHVAAGGTDRRGGDERARGDDGDVGDAVADVDQHLRVRRRDVEAGADGGRERLGRELDR